MGMTIDTDRVNELLDESKFYYENRLKADMVTLLTELQLDIEECVDGGEGSPQFEQGVAIARTQVLEMMQQKINELQAESEDVR